jgi:hypothetical protein|tara:strand:+ start:255 stop:479 length:225 start_codon:yes stop_codon:yes gene_type:complete
MRKSQHVNHVKELFDSEKEDLQNFIEENLKDGAAVPHPDDLFDAVEGGHYELSRFRTKSGNPEIWFGIYPDIED